MTTKSGTIATNLVKKEYRNMTSKPMALFRFNKSNEQLRQLIANHIDETAFVDGVNRARLQLGSTKIFGSSYKLDKSNAIDAVDLAMLGIDDREYLNIVLYMPPADSSGKWNFCVWATPGCRAVCLGVASGRMNHGYENAKNRVFDWDKTDTSKAQMKRAVLFMTDRFAFTCQSVLEIYNHRQKAIKKELGAAVRPNGTTDIPWEKTMKVVLDIFGDSIQWYDYTKAPRSVRNSVPANYHLTFSRAETKENQLNALEWLKDGFNAAVVFKAEKHDLPEEFEGMPVLDGDVHDMRFKDPTGHWVGLSAKGAAKKDTSGFVVEIK